MSTILSRGTSHRNLMEAITLLYMLNECPESPKDNQQPQTLPALSSKYQLPFQREKQIVESLAFLSATKNDSDRVTAVCLEEARDRGSCNIRLTSNSGDINEVLLGFKLMAKILEQAASRANSKDDDTKALFRCIVTLEYCRILSRLRSKHTKKSSRNKDKPVLITLLDTALQDQSVQPSPNLTDMELTKVLEKIKTLKALFKRFEDIQEHSAASSEVQDVAMELIIQMHELASQTKLNLALDCSKTLTSELKTSLPDDVMELGRYYSVSYELVGLVRSEQYSIFNSISVETAPTGCPSQPSNIDKNVHPTQALQNILRPGNAVQSRSLKSSLEKCLGKPMQVILDEYRSTVADYYKSVKVHAEIQLLFFYELNSERVRPRTICSSKSACYLCDLFFRLHGQYYVPRTHGRLYHRWTLPNWHIFLPEMRRREFDVLLNNFRDILKVKVRVALDKGPVRATHPNESTLVKSLPPMTQLPERVVPNRPIASIDPASSCSTTRDPLSSEPPSQAELLVDSTSSVLLSTSTLYESAEEPMNPRAFSSRDTTTKTHTPSPLPPLSPSSTASPKLHHELTEGDPSRHPILYPNISINVGTARLNLDLSSETTACLDPNLPSDPSHRYSVRVKWLQGTETGNVNSQAINAESSSYDTEMEIYHGATRTPTELHLKQGGDFVSIKFTFDEPKSH